MFEGVNLKWTSSRFYYLVFWARRMISICLSLLTNFKMGTIVLLVILFLNILYTIYIGRQRRLIKLNLNFQERFNELIVSGCYYMLIIQTDWVPSQIKKFFHGFMLTYLVIFYSFVNILLILYVNFKSVKAVI